MPNWRLIEHREGKRGSLSVIKFYAISDFAALTLPPQNGLLSKAVLMRGEAKYDKVNAGTLHA